MFKKNIHELYFRYTIKMNDGLRQLGKIMALNSSDICRYYATQVYYHYAKIGRHIPNGRLVCKWFVFPVKCTYGV